MRATALRVATDLFCQAAAPLQADISRYVDLALPLLDSVDRDTRRAVAEKLAVIEHAPAAVVARLRNDPDPFVSGAILSSPAVFQPDDLSAFVARCTTAEAAATARRVDLTPAAIRTLATHRSAFVVEVLIENPAIALPDDIVDHLVERAADEPRLIAALLSRTDLAPDRLAPLYAEAPRPLRENIRRALADTAARSASVPASSLAELTEAFARPNRDGVGQALAHVLKLRPQRLPKLLDDPTAELFALALSAAGAKRAAAINILLIATPEEVRTSVETIFAAVKVLDATPRNVALQIVSAVAGERRVPRPAAVYEPHMHPSTTPQRVASRVRRLAAQRDVSRTRSSGS
jgi:uncharacterized protein (DUF2336 family)